MITLTTGTALAILGLFITVALATQGFVWRAGKKLGEFGQVLKELSEAVKGLSKLGERVLVLEVKDAAREKREGKK